MVGFAFFAACASGTAERESRAPQTNIPSTSATAGMNGAAPNTGGSAGATSSAATAGEHHGSAAAVAGSHAAPPPPDAPTGVTFDWPETVPGSRGSCKAGHYVGEYSCRLYIIATDGPGAFDMSGTIDMQLEQTMDGERLRIEDGHFESTSAAVIPASADIVGELKCSSDRFEGMLQNGSFSVALGLPVPFTEGTFEGPLSADYDKVTSSMKGEWNMQGELDGFPGSCMDGAWSAHYVP